MVYKKKLTLQTLKLLQILQTVIICEFSNCSVTFFEGKKCLHEMLLSWS